MHTHSPTAGLPVTRTVLPAASVPDPDDADLVRVYPCGDRLSTGSDILRSRALLSGPTQADDEGPVTRPLIRTTRLSRHYHLADGNLRLAHEVDAGRNTAHIVRAGMQFPDLPTADIEEAACGRLAGHGRREP